MRGFKDVQTFKSYSNITTVLESIRENPRQTISRHLQERDFSATLTWQNLTNLGSYC